MLITYNIIVVEEGFFQLGHPSTALAIGYPNIYISKIYSNKLDNKIQDVSISLLI